MRKILSIMMVFCFIATVCFGANEFRKGTGEEVILGSESPSDIDTVSFENIVDPIDRMLSKYQRNCSLVYASSSTLTISIGEVMCQNTAGTIRRMRANTSAIPLTWSDIDTDSEAAGTYYVYAVADADATTFTGIISLSSSSPTGVTYYKRLGSFVNNVGLDIERGSITNDNNTYALEFGDWSSKTDGTVYEATTDGFVVTNGSSGTVSGYTDSSNPPTTVRTSSSEDADPHLVGICMPVKKGDYFKTVGATNVYWIPVE